MKRSLLIPVVLFLYIVSNAQNTFPVNGNVGIGTTTPASKLHVFGVVSINNQGSATPSASLNFQLNGTSRADIAVAPALNYFANNANAGDMVLRTYGSRMLFSTNTGTSTAMSISGANVGIGVMSPASRLQVGAPIPGAAQQKVLSVNDASITDFANLGHFNTSLSTARAGLIVSNSSTGRWEDNFIQLMAHGSGFPQNLYLNNVTNHLTDGGWNYLVSQGAQNKGLGITTVGEVPLTLGTLNTIRLLVNGSTGNISIGVIDDAPPAKLTIRNAEPWFTSQFANDATGKVMKMSRNGGRDFDFIINYDSSLVIASNNNDVVTKIMRLVGGVNGQRSRVEVKGEIWAGLTLVPDYVFNNQYPLMTIDQVEAYVQKHHHLPNVKSEKEFKQDGHINVVEMNMKLLEKLEENTLYIIQLNNKIKTLEAKVQQLEEKR
jgi:hypothetical protein